jgi:hypothetical protein
LQELSIEGVPQADLDQSVKRVEELQHWARENSIDRWAFRASLLKALAEDAEQFFSETKGTFREIAAFDNGVATALDSLKKL